MSTYLQLLFLSNSSVSQGVIGHWRQQIEDGNITIDGLNRLFPIFFASQNGSSLLITFEGVLLKYFCMIFSDYYQT